MTSWILRLFTSPCPHASMPWSNWLGAVAVDLHNKGYDFADIRPTRRWKKLWRRGYGPRRAAAIIESREFRGKKACFRSV